MRVIRFINKGIRIIYRRIKKQGVRITAVWVIARGIPKLTGVPLLQFSRVTPQLYVGPQYNQKGYEHLLNSGIEYGVNLRVEYNDAEYGISLPYYCYLPTIDDDAPTMLHLEEGARFITDAIEAGGKVYIHCAGGIGRAPTMATAYLVSQGYSLQEAIKLIKRVRPFINIMPVQMERLKEFEEVHIRKKRDLKEESATIDT